MTLAELGWADFFANSYAEIADEKWVLGRLIRETKINFSALLDEGEEVDCVVGLSLIHI